MQLRLFAVAAIITFLPAISFAAPPAKAAQTEEKREWLRKQLTTNVNNRAALRDINAKLDRMTPDQIDQLGAHYQRQLAVAQRQLEQALAARAQLQNQLRRQNNVGYAPVITWLPEGTSLRTSALVSPDRRYVRINASPFFSSIPYVDTFNLQTGQTNRYPQYPPSYYPNPHQSGYPIMRQQPQSVQPQPQSGQVESYYDGLRTRYRRK